MNAAQKRLNKIMNLKNQKAKEVLKSLESLGHNPNRKSVRSAANQLAFNFAKDQIK